jgi:hypothetical protein
MRSDEMGQIKPGNFADCVLVDGDPLDNITILQDHSKLNVIMINGRVHKAGRKELLIPSAAASQELTERITQAIDELEIKAPMQKAY